MNLNYRFLLLCITIIIIKNLYAHNYRTLSGKVLSAKDSLPIEFANICVKNQPIGCISNENGEFVFHIPEIYASDTLVISNISYNSYEKPLLQIIKNKITVYLDEADYEIGEVIVLPDGLTVEKIVENYIKNIRKNYPRQKYYYEIFYRGLMYNKLKNEYQQLVELAAGIMDYGFDDDTDRKRIKIHEMRKSIDFVDYINRIHKKAIELIYGKINILYDILQINIVNITNPNVKDRTTPNKNIEYLTFIDSNLFLDKIINIDSTNIYVINFDKKKNENTGFNGRLYIRSDDYALIKAEFGWYMKLKQNSWTTKSLYKNSKFGEDNYYWYFKTNEYRKYGNKYFLTFVKDISYNKILANQGILGEHILVVNNIYTRERDYKRIRKKHAEKKNVYLYDKDMEYHPEFWKHYNILQTNPLHEKAIRDLEKEKKLEEQFEENGE